MPRNEIIVLLVVIVLTASFISLYLNSVFKLKKSKSKPEEKEPKQEVQKEEAPKQENIQKEEKKHEKEKLKTPQVSVALQDELEEFKTYLKSRISDTNEPSIHPYEAPKVDRFRDSSYIPNFERDFNRDFDFPDFDSPLSDDFFDDDFSRDFAGYSRNKKNTLNETKIENLPENIKIMLFSNLFDSKF